MCFGGALPDDQPRGNFSIRKSLRDQCDDLAFASLRPESVASGKGLAKLRAEAKKCVLVCANCHGEIESGVIPSPPPGATFSRA